MNFSNLSLKTQASDLHCKRGHSVSLDQQCMETTATAVTNTCEAQPPASNPQPVSLQEKSPFPWSPAQWGYREPLASWLRSYQQGEGLLEINRARSPSLEKLIAQGPGPCKHFLLLSLRAPPSLGWALSPRD
jgi:hypothetical protein